MDIGGREIEKAREENDVDGVEESVDTARRDSAPGGVAALAEVEEMRIQIKQLYQKKTEALMKKVVELEKVRDVAIGRGQILEEALKVLNAEMASLKETNSKLVAKTADLKIKLVDERMNTSDLNQKLKMSATKITHLKMELKSLKKRPSGDSNSWLQVSEVESSLERSQSLNDIGDEVEKEKSEKGESKNNNAPASNVQNGDASPALLKDTPKYTSSPLVQNRVAVTIATSTPTSSPTVVPKRYKLSTETTEEFGVQTEGVEEEKSAKMKELEDAHKVVKEALERTIKSLEETVRANEEDRRKQGKSIKEIKKEQDVLQTGLNAFKEWVEQKLQSVGDDIDSCRVVYSLYGSMSQEAQVIRKLKEKLEKSVQEKRDAEALNNYLKDNIQTLEDQLKLSKKQNDLDKQKILLLSPVKAPTTNQTLRVSKMKSPATQYNSPQTLRSPVAPPSLPRQARTPQTTRLFSTQNPSAIPQTTLNPLPILMSSEQPGSNSQSSKRKEKSDSRKRNLKDRSGGGKHGSKDRGGVKDGDNTVAERLVMKGGKWYSVPDNDDDDDSFV